MDSLFIEGRVEKSLLAVNEPHGLWDNIMNLMGQARFNESLVFMAGLRSSNTISAMVLGMNAQLMEVKVS